METLHSLNLDNFTELGWATLPLIGQDASSYTTFEYIPIAVSQYKLVIALPSWSEIQGRINKDDKIILNIGFKFSNTILNYGTVNKIWFNEEYSSQIAEIMLSDNLAGQINYNRKYNLVVEIENGKIQVTGLSNYNGSSISELLNDISNINRGISVYISHLIPYYSRITDYSEKNYKQLKDSIWLNIKEQVDISTKKLSDLSNAVSSNKTNTTDLFTLIDLGEVRRLIESPIPIDLFSITFPNEEALRYIKSVKLLERNLYSNYNSLLGFYSLSLAS